MYIPFGTLMLIGAVAGWAIGRRKDQGLLGAIVGVPAAVVLYTAVIYISAKTAYLFS